MTDRAHLRALVAQADALAEQATALGMQAETLKRTVQAMLASLPPVTTEAKTTGPTVVPPKYFNEPRTTTT